MSYLDQILRGQVDFFAIHTYDAGVGLDGKSAADQVVLSMAA